MSTLQQIGLAIHEPAHEQVFIATGADTTVPVTLRGEITSTTFPNPAVLFRTWYSSLDAEVLGTADEVTRPLAVGSHIITYTVKDKDETGVPPDELEAFYKSVEHIGAAGGPPDPPPAEGKPPCVVHVLAARIVTPPGDQNLSKGNAVLEAAAPLQWGKYVDGEPIYEEPDPAYHAVNKLRYRWIFRRTPAGPPIELDVGGGAAMKLVPPTADDQPPVLRYSGVLPAALVVGVQYRLTLRVEHADDPAKGHEASRTVTIT